jgi:hypothetical protein
MKLTDLLSPKEFSALANRSYLSDGDRNRAMEDVKPYFHALVEIGFVDEHTTEEVACFMTALSVFQQCLNEKVAA